MVDPAQRIFHFFSPLAGNNCLPIACVRAPQRFMPLNWTSFSIASKRKIVKSIAIRQPFHHASAPFCAFPPTSRPFPSPRSTERTKIPANHSFIAGISHLSPRQWDLIEAHASQMVFSPQRVRTDVRIARVRFGRLIPVRPSRHRGTCHSRLGRARNSPCTSRYTLQTNA